MKKPHVFQQIQLIFWFIFAALLIFAVTAIMLAPKVNATINWSPQDLETLKSVIVILALGGIPAGFIFHTHQVKKIPADIPLHNKLLQYRNSYFIKIVTLEALAIIALIGHLISADKSFAIIFGLLFVAYTLNMPRWQNIIKEINVVEE
ncbi:hypothetical protein [Alkaliflexus imshenetskii]|uniref:hypothetical protein n=1 Tax=Alkaliflexus imshenetskii TaxID=286730 RepID=UPI00047E96B3|nr:hypothetical protein [Alkaliflexus imshenetskii]